MIDVEDTIVAIASPPSPAVRGIVRLSGNDVSQVLTRLKIHNESRRPVRFEAAIKLGPPLGEIPLSVMLWPNPRSYTGQPSAELHTFGSVPILQAVMDAVIAAGARAARPGEFTMRAFLAGRLDLTQAEAVLGVIDAENRGALDHALRQLAGNLSKPLEQIRSSLLNLLADVEAGLDFVDEDIDFISDDELVEQLNQMSKSLRATRESMQTRGGGTTIPTIVVRGDPNAGKSRLINRLAGRHVAIVADVAGTTRDVVSIDAVIGRHRVQLVDTAGIEKANSRTDEREISRQSQGQASRAGRDADVRVWCVDASRPDFAEAAAVINRRVQESSSRRRSSSDLFVATKADIIDNVSVPDGWLLTSSANGQGIEALGDAIGEALTLHDSQEVGSVLGTAARCRETLSGAIRAIDTAIGLVSGAEGHEFVASELREAAQCLGEVTGAVYTDDILDRVFSRFCIGK